MKKRPRRSKIPEAGKASGHDPLGMYTGVPKDEDDPKPVQDADDL